MNVKALLRADTRLGLPLCFAFSCLRAVFGRAQAELPPPKKILFIKLAEQGSTVLAYPALRRAVEIVGRENVYFVALDDNRFILDLLQVIPPENVIAIPHKKFSALLLGAFAALRRIRALRIDTVVDMEFFARGSAVLGFLSGASRRVGFHAYFGDAPYRGNLMTHRVLYNPHLHTTETFLSLVEAGVRDPASLPNFNWRPPASVEAPPPFAATAEELGVVKDLLRRETGSESPQLILLNANCSDLLPLRRWPEDSYVELARRLLVKFPAAHIAFTGAPEEAAATTQLVAKVADPRCVLLAGKTTLRQLLVLYTLAKVLVTNDSGPAHFATLTPVQVITLFGPETPTLFAARTPRNTVLWAGIACSPCVSAYNNRQSACRDNQCMKAISVAQVFDAACAAYEKPRG